MPLRIPIHRPLVLLALLLAAVASLPGQPSLPDSPFLPPATAAVAPARAAAAGYDLVGMTVVGKDVLVSINRKSDKHSVWIAVGKTVGEITAVSYDPQTDSAVIRADHQTLTLTMRKGGVIAGPLMAPSNFVAAPVPTLAAPAPMLPPVSGPAKPMNSQEEKETEARMLVSDLLEIGQQQRKAYAEAQRQAALRAADPKMPRAEAAVPPKH